MAPRVARIKLGSQGLEVSAQGLGCLGMSAFYGPPKPEPDMISLNHHAIKSGITFLDTSDMYGPFTDEILLGKVDFLLLFLSSFFSASIHVLSIYNTHFIFHKTWIFFECLWSWKWANACTGTQRRSERQSRARYEVHRPHCRRQVGGSQRPWVCEGSLKRLWVDCIDLHY